MRSLQDRVESGAYEQVEVRADGERVTVWNWVNINLPAHVRGHNPITETFEDQMDINAGSTTQTPEAVSDLVAQNLEDEYRVDVEEHGIDVIDPTAEEVDLI